MKLGSALIQAVAAMSCFVIGCSLSDQYAKKTAPVAFITTPPSYYSSAKARSLGAKYKQNLDRLAERIVRNPRTASLQFANNLSSVGGIGFFTHSATSIPDERYLEVIVSTPESFDDRETFESKVARVFAAYGRELLSILAGDSALYQETDLSGYGLNLTWRSIAQTLGASRINVEGAVLYLKKEAVGSFLQTNLDQEKVLAGAIIFAASESGSLKLVSYRQTDQKADLRSPLYEESLDVTRADAKIERRAATSQLGVGAEKEALRPSTVARADGSTSKAVVAAAPKQQPADGSRQNHMVSNKPARAGGLEEERDLLREQGSEGRSESGDGFVGSKGGSSRHDGQQIESPSVLSSPPPAIPAEPARMVEQVQKSRINKSSDVTADLGKAEERSNTVERGRGQWQRPEVATGRISVSTETAAAEKSLLRTESPDAGTSESIEATASEIAAAEVSGVEQESTEKTAATSSNTAPRVQAPSAKGVRGEEKADFQSLMTRPVGPTEKTRPSEEAPRQTASALPAQGNSLGMSNPPVNSGAKHLAQKNLLAMDRNTAVGGTDDEAGTMVSSTVTGPSGNPKLPKEQIAAVKKGLADRAAGIRAGAQLLPRLLEGYVIQVGFDNRSTAQHWGEKLERRGYAVSVTEADGEGLVRLRLGNFTIREEAEKQLKVLKDEGLRGIVINLPQGYRPEQRADTVEKSAQSARTND